MGWLNVTEGAPAPSFPNGSTVRQPAFSTYYDLADTNVITTTAVTSADIATVDFDAASLSVLATEHCADALRAIDVAVEKYRGTSVWGNKVDPFSEMECDPYTRGDEADDAGDGNANGSTVLSTFLIRAFDKSACHDAASVLNQMVDAYSHAAFEGCTTTSTTVTGTSTATTRTLTTKTRTRTTRTTTFLCKEFTCTSGDECLRYKRVCDGVADCSDSSDEAVGVHTAAGCSTTTTPTATTSTTTTATTTSSSSSTLTTVFRCVGNYSSACASQDECVKPEWTCDGYPDCTDGSDETSHMHCAPATTSAATAWPGTSPSVASSKVPPVNESYATATSLASPNVSFSTLSSPMVGTSAPRTPAGTDAPKPSKKSDDATVAENSDAASNLHIGRATGHTTHRLWWVPAFGLLMLALLLGVCYCTCPAKQVPIPWWAGTLARIANAEARFGGRRGADLVHLQAAPAVGNSYRRNDGYGSNRGAKVVNPTFSVSSSGSSPPDGGDEDEDEDGASST